MGFELFKPETALAFGDFSANLNPPRLGNSFATPIFTLSYGNSK
jgi:hypothetical protein